MFFRTTPAPTITKMKTTNIVLTILAIICILTMVVTLNLAFGQVVAGGKPNVANCVLIDTVYHDPGCKLVGKAKKKGMQVIATEEDICIANGYWRCLVCHRKKGDGSNRSFKKG